MKIKITVLVILFLAAIILVLSGMFHNRYKLQLIIKFTIPGITINPQHKVLDGYAVSFALSDSLIYVTDTNDSTHTKSYCYKYSGESYTGFHFPTDKGYGEVFVDKNLYYLPQSNMLAYNYWQNNQIDYYSTDGTYIRSEVPHSSLNVNILNMAEYMNSIYFTSMSESNTKPRTNMAVMQLYKEQSNQAPIVLKNIDITKESINKHFSFRNLMIDDNGKDSMLLLENQYDKPHASLFLNNTTNEFVIRTPFVFGIHKIGKLPFQVDKGLSKEPYQLVLGQDFLIIGSMNLDRQYPLVQRIYNLKGNYLGKLKFKDDPQNEMIDIIDDRLVTFNPAKGIVSIYKISIR